MNAQDSSPAGAPDPTTTEQLRLELAAALAQLAAVKRLLIAKLAETKPVWWRRRRSLQELAEELVLMLHLSEEELRQAASAPDPGQSLVSKPPP